MDRSSLLLTPCLLLTLAAGCARHAEVEAEAPPAQPAVTQPAEVTPTPYPAAGSADGDFSFGAPLALIDTTSLAEIARDPSRFSGQVVQTTGEIASVCQTRGCWMEIRDEGVAPIRVPMAGHSFFLPRDVAGRRATLEGTVSLRELISDRREISRPSRRSRTPLAALNRLGMHGAFLRRFALRATPDPVRSDLLISRRLLTPEERDHLAGEGALATAQPLEIAATGVIIH